MMNCSCKEGKKEKSSVENRVQRSVITDRTVAKGGNVGNAGVFVDFVNKITETSIMFS